MSNIIELKKKKKLINIAKEIKRATLLTLSPKQQITKVKQLNNSSHLHKIMLNIQ